MSLEDGNFDFGRADYNERFGATPGEDAEPVFLLRGKDMAASVAVRQWVSMAKDYGVDMDMLIAGNTMAERLRRYAEAGDRVPASLPEG